MKKRILIVDDDSLITKIVSQILSTFGGYETLAVNEPQAAVAAAESFQPSAVLLDYQMPTMTGEAVLAALRQHDGMDHLPVVLLSGDCSWTVKPDQFTALLQKPLTAKELLSTVNSLLEHSSEQILAAA
jgi:CheY-like chemotaxis protein